MALPLNGAVGMNFRLFPSFIKSSCTFGTANYLRNLSTKQHAEHDKSNYERRVFSGIQPTGIPHIGNYLGAIKQWVRLQEKWGNTIISIVDLHAMTLPQNPDNLRQNIMDMAACLIACGIDPQKTILFQQSAVSEHAELAWILSCLTTKARLNHLPQWKQKSESLTDGVPLGLFTYPVLQSADILLYQATHVPVGQDQAKHIDYTKELVKLFNNKYGEYFVKPRIIMADFNRTMSLRNPDKKMSKSDKDPKGRIELLDSPSMIRDKIKKAVTDADPTITYDPQNRKAISNLIELHSAVTDLDPEEIVQRSLCMDTVGYKDEVIEAVIGEVEPIRQELVRLQEDRAYLQTVLSEGNEKAKSIASKTYAGVRQLVGLV